MPSNTLPTATESLTVVGAPLPPVGRHEHVPVSKQQTAARNAEASELAGSDPSVDGADVDAAEIGDFALGEELVIPGAANLPHDLHPPATEDVCMLAGRLAFVAHSKVSVSDSSAIRIPIPCKT